MMVGEAEFTMETLVRVGPDAVINETDELPETGYLKKNEFLAWLLAMGRTLDN